MSFCSLRLASQDGGGGECDVLRLVGADVCRCGALLGGGVGRCVRCPPGGGAAEPDEVSSLESCQPMIEPAAMMTTAMTASNTLRWV
jgi:hypothetical protein